MNHSLLLALAMGALVSGLGLSGCADLSATTAVNAPIPADDGPITAENLPLRDDYWPHRVMLTETWTPESGEPVRPKGVLLRVENAQVARVDFGRGGIHEVPIRVTDLVESANALHAQGPGAKIGNLTRMIGGALGDPHYEVWRAYRRSKLARRDLLLVAAPLAPESLREMAAPLERIDAMDGVRVILLPQGGTPSDEALGVLHEIGWRTAFLRQRYVRATTRGYLGDDLALPWLALLTPNGRVLHAGPWPPDGDLQPVLGALSERQRER